MDTNPHHRGVAIVSSDGIRPVTREMVHARTRELALFAGRISSNVSQADYEQARPDQPRPAAVSSIIRSIGSARLRDSMRGPA